MVGRLRHVYVSERRQGPGIAAEGPTDKQAAQIMGNTTAEWDKVYDLDFSRREGEAGVAAMAQWREEMLSRAASRSQKAQMEFDEEEVIDLDDFEIDFDL
jgi:hypothetical protein